MRLPTLLMGLLLTAGNAAAQPTWHGLALGMSADRAAEIIRAAGSPVFEKPGKNASREMSFSALGPAELFATLRFRADRLRAMRIEYYAPDWNPHGTDRRRCDSLFSEAHADLALFLRGAARSVAVREGVTSVRLVRRRRHLTAELVEKSAANACAAVFATLSDGGSLAPPLRPAQ